MLSKKPVVLVMADWFDPGFKAGGPIRSVVNVANTLATDLEIFVITTDRDLGDTKPYDGIDPDTWTKYKEHVQVFYASPGSLSFNSIKKLIHSIEPDVIYLNSMYSKFFAVYPLLLKRLENVKSKVVLAPRGMLRESAVQFKSAKKKTFLRLFRLLGLSKYVQFHCTDETELRDVQKYFGNARCTLLSNIPAMQGKLQLPAEKRSGYAKLIFIGRMHPIKNLHFLLLLLKTVRSHISLTVIAGEEDKEYRNRCLELAAELPSNIQVQFINELQHRELEHQIREHHLFVLPTKGENFGHAIFEALSAGRPVLISDQTPWRKLEEHKTGWDLPLDQPSAFAEVIERVAAMNKAELDEWCLSAWNFTRTYVDGLGIKKEYLKLFS